MNLVNHFSFEKQWKIISVHLCPQETTLTAGGSACGNQRLFYSHVSKTAVELPWAWLARGFLNWRLHVLPVNFSFLDRADSITWLFKTMLICAMGSGLQASFPQWPVWMKISGLIQKLRAGEQHRKPETSTALERLSPFDIPGTLAPFDDVWHTFSPHV